MEDKHASSDDRFIEDCFATMTDSCWDKRYLRSKIVSEVGEVLGAIGKHIRGDYGFDELCKRVVSEVGDVLWYHAMIVRFLRENCRLGTHPAMYGLSKTLFCDGSKYNAGGPKDLIVTKLEESAEWCAVYASQIPVVDWNTDQRRVVELLVAVHSALASCLDYVGSDIPRARKILIDKLADRKSRGVIMGSGDDR